jgi:O-antigen ligase/tetratricopeptide (TPR) repeat protein
MSAIFSSVFLVLALVSAVLIGSQTRQWAWGPSLVLLGLALLAAVPRLWKARNPPSVPLILLTVTTAGWFAWRAAISPVWEFGAADLLLLGGAVAGFLVMRPVAGHETAAKVFLWSLALLLLGSVVVIGMQVRDPAFSPVFPSRPVVLPSGFFSHYNEGANFLICAAFLLAGAALLAPVSLVTRLLWGVVAVAGMAAVYFTRSRGGILAVALGAVVFTLLLLVILKRRRSRSFIWLAISAPLVGIAAAVFLWQGWVQAQQLRFGAGAETVIDNSIRITLLGIASQCIQLAPWIGGGSRSFSWNCFRFWDFPAYGAAHARPEMVHNELVQSATDYGVIGTLLIIALLATVLLAPLLRVIFSKRPASPMSALWLVGGMSALAGMLVQSSFSFVFHLFPGALLLGVCLGALLENEAEPRDAARTGGQAAGRWVFALLALFSGLTLIAAGWTRSRVLLVLWPVYFQQSPEVPPETRLAALSKATGLLPLPSLLADQAHLLYTISLSDDPDHVQAGDLAVETYTRAIALNPYDPIFWVTRAELFSIAGKNEAAEADYAETIRLQGGTEDLFLGNFRFAEHYYRKGFQQLKARNYAAALASFQDGLRRVDGVRRQQEWILQHPPGLKLEEGLNENAGIAAEATGDYDTAAKLYDAAAKFPAGGANHYRLAVLLGKLGDTAWSERRPSEALSRYQEARQHIAAATALPAEVAPARKIDYDHYLESRIEYLVGAKIEPLPK